MSHSNSLLSNNTIVIAGISGGKDSTALALWLVHESGIPRERIVLQFMDTNNEDSLTYAFLDLLEKSVGEIERITLGESFFELAERKKRFPSRKVRFCTTELKVFPGQRMLATWIDMAKLDELQVIKAAGSRHEEGHSSNNRGDLLEFAWDAWAIDEVSYAIQMWYPIREWTIEDVWEIHRRYLDMDRLMHMVESDSEMPGNTRTVLLGNMKRSGIPRNPLYDMGAVRVGCFPCINSKKKEIRAMTYFRPDRVDFIREREQAISALRNGKYSSFFARNTVPMRFRSKKLIGSNGEPIIDGETGEVMLVATIDDVVEWSKTKYGARQYEMYFPDEDSGACLIGGECE